VPAVAPYTTPVVAAIEATPGAELLQVPPDVALLRVAVFPVQTEDTPPMAPMDVPVTVNPSVWVTEPHVLEIV
jgi:hypothetical protein